jgi:hypothetical protein
MAHYAYLDENNIVVAVTVGKDETELIDGLDTETYYALGTPYTVKRTSYWTSGNVHYGDDGSPAFRKNYAGIGYSFDGIGFFAPQPYPSWTLNLETYLWEAPVPYPADGKEFEYVWDEATLSWVEVQP